MALTVLHAFLQSEESLQGTTESLAEAAYEQADAMLTERDKENEDERR